MSKNFTKTYAAGQQPKEQDECTATLRYDLSPAVVEEGIQLKLIEMGWTPPRAEQPAQQEPSPTAGMNIAQRILHVGGRNNAAGYVEFGSIQAVEALVRQVLRDQPQREPVAQPSQQDIPDILAGALGVSRGTAYQLMREVLAEQPAPVAATAWQQGYNQGVADERTSEANIGIAGFDAKVNPARNNPYTTPQAQPAREPLTNDQIDKAAMKLAECMDYPWAQMPEQGKQSVRSHAKAVIDASGITKGEA